jgi:Alkylmercury lyase
VTEPDSPVTPGPPRADLTPRQARVRAAAFRLLLESGRPVPPEPVAARVGAGTAEVVADLRVLSDTGRVRLADGAVLGSLGLTMVETNHEIGGLAGAAGVRWHTWCALDALGILGALGVDGWIRSTTPGTGDRFDLTLVAGVPQGYDPGYVMFLAGQQGPISSVIDQWCPLVNFFVDARSALEWSERTGVAGECLDLAAASELATRLWRPALGEPPAGTGA